jgi:hypothetical protein
MWHAFGLLFSAAYCVRLIMNQLIVKPEQLLSTRSFEASSPVSISDAVPKNEAPHIHRPPAIWPVVAIGIGGLATLAWNGFLLWHTARAVIGWVSGDL